MEIIDKISRELTSRQLNYYKTNISISQNFKRSCKKLIKETGPFIDSLAACGDINRNVLCNSNPLESVHHEETKDAVSVSNHLLPKSQAYHEIWLDEEKVADVKEEKAIYGSTYLPENLKSQ